MLDSRPDDFDGRNLFFWACLGLLSASRRLDDALAVDIPEGAGEAEITDPGLLAVLGAVAFRLRFSEVLGGAPDSWASAPGEGGEGAAGAAGDPAGGRLQGVTALRELMR